MSPSQLLQIFVEAGCRRVIAKALAPNDNSKNQIYLGGDYGAIQLLPFGRLTSDSTPVSDSRRERLKASITWSWIDDEGNFRPAPNANLILYPKYPEVRLSGFLVGVGDQRISDVIAGRHEGRWIFLGIHPEGRVIAWVGHSKHPCAAWAREQSASWESRGVFREIPLLGSDPRSRIKSALRAIANRGWLDSRRLDRNGNSLPCLAQQCGGYTLEAELGIIPNGRSEPDYDGWEVKQFASLKLGNPSLSGRLTLFTPEPDGGLYVEEGISKFLRLYGYPDQNGVPDRINYGGLHRVGVIQARTALMMELHGWDSKNGKIVELDGGVRLVDLKGNVAARWSFQALINHWKRKHAQAVYVPCCKGPGGLQYRFGNRVFAGTGADFGRVLQAFATGQVVYDPAIKMERASSSRPAVKRRSQFRIQFGQLPALYERTEWWDL